MNQELRQRIIGAIVVTALAAIFIPMLFDDPIDDSGQTVSELTIPDNQVNIIEDVSPLPANAEDVVKTTEENNAAIKNTPELSDVQAPADSGLEPDQLPRDGEEDMDDEEPANAALDTGEVDETPASHQRIPVPVKKPAASKPLSSVATTKKMPDPATATAKIKTTPVVKPANASVAPTAKAKPPADLQRWSVQAGSFSKKENALAMLETLKKQGVPVTLESRNSLYRLKVGANLDKKHALAMKAKLDQLNIQNMLLPE
jgi:DedD protein